MYLAACIAQIAMHVLQPVSVGVHLCVSLGVCVEGTFTLPLHLGTQSAQLVVNPSPNGLPVGPKSESLPRLLCLP